MALLVGLAGRPRPPLERPRMGRPPGLRRRDRPDSSGRCCRSASSPRPSRSTSTSGPCPTRTRPPGRSATTSSPSWSRARSSRGCSSTTSRTACCSSATCRRAAALWRDVFLADTDGPAQPGRLPGGPRAHGARPRPPDRRARARGRHPAHEQGRRAPGLQRGAVPAAGAEPRSRDGVSPERPRQGRPRDVDCRAPGAHRHARSSRGSRRTTP